MNILYQYYNEVVLAFDDYEVELRESVILILVPESNKPFDVVCQKINAQLHRIAETLDLRDKEIIVKVERNDVNKVLVLEKQV